MASEEEWGEGSEGTVQTAVVHFTRGRASSPSRSRVHITSVGEENGDQLPVGLVGTRLSTQLAVDSDLSVLGLVRIRCLEQPRLDHIPSRDVLLATGLVLHLGLDSVGEPLDDGVAQEGADVLKPAPLGLLLNFGEGLAYITLGRFSHPRGETVRPGNVGCLQGRGSPWL